MKIAVLSGMFSGYGGSLAKGFEALGNEVKIFEYSKSDQGYMGILRHSIPRRMGFDTEKNDRRKFYNKILGEICSFQPEAIMVVSGVVKDFFSEIITFYIEKTGKKPRTAIWYMDSIKKIPGKIPPRSFFDNWFLLEPSDIPFVKKEMGLKADFLASSYDSDYYRPIESVGSSESFSWELSFVGSIAYSNRKIFLERLSKKAFQEGLKFQVVSDCYRFPTLYLMRQPYLRKNILREGADHKRNNLLYNDCKVNLNIHASQCVEGLNARFFEVLGSGGLQIVEPKKAQNLLGFTADKDFLTFSGINDLEEKIKFVLENPKKAEEISQSGHKKVKNHDFKARAKFIMGDAFCK